MIDLSNSFVEQKIGSKLQEIHNIVIENFSLEKAEKIGEMIDTYFEDIMNVLEKDSK